MEEDTLNIAEQAKLALPIGDEPKEETTDKDIVISLKIPYQIAENKVLIKPLDAEKIKKQLVVLDEKKNKNKKYGDELATKKVVKNVETDYRHGVILGIGSRVSQITSLPLEIGDTIVFHKNVMNNSYFDLYKDSILLNAYDVVAKYTK